MSNLQRRVGLVRAGRDGRLPGAAGRRTAAPWPAAATNAGGLREGDWVANGTLFTLYHVHEPWSMPATLLDASSVRGYPTKRYRSTWMGIITHTLPSFIITGIVLSLVLK